MTQCNSFNEKLSNSQRNKLKSAIQNETEVILERMSSNKMAILMMKLIFHIKYYQLIDTLQIFVSFFQIIHQLISSYQKLNYPKKYRQEDFFGELLVYY